MTREPQRRAIGFTPSSCTNGSPSSVKDRAPTRSRRRQGRRPEPRMRAARAPRPRSARRTATAASGSTRSHSSKSRRMGTTDWTAGHGRSMCSKRPTNPLVGNSPVRSRDVEPESPGHGEGECAAARKDDPRPRGATRGPRGRQRADHDACRKQLPFALRQHRAGEEQRREAKAATCAAPRAREPPATRPGQRGNPGGSRPAARVSARRSVGQRGRGAGPASAACPRGAGARRRPRRSL